MLEVCPNYADAILESAFRIPHDAPPRWLVVFTAYLDETGQEQDDWMFVAGFFGPDDAWRRVSDSWRKAIAPRQHLHVQTQRFRKESVRRMLERAGPVAVECGLTPMVGGVRQKDYLDLLKGTREEKLLNGYVTCCHFAVFNALRSLPPGERLEVVFEQQDQYGWMNEIAMQVMADIPHPELILPDGRHKLASWRSVPKGSTVLIEPADYFAFALRQLWRDDKSQKTSWCRSMLDACDGKAVGYIMRRREIRFATIGGFIERVVNDMRAGRNPFANRDEYEAFKRVLDSITGSDPNTALL